MNTVPRMPHHDRFPELGTGPVSVEPYISQDYYEKEIEKIYKRDWLCVGRVEEIPKTGDYKVKRLDFANTSALIMRGKDGQIRSFHNVCRHRGNKVVTETGGEETFGNSRAAVVTCRFHGWVYDAKGQLINVPQEDRFSSCFDKSNIGLVPIHTDVWEGFIWINLAETPRQTLREFLGGLVEHYAGYPFHTMTDVHTYYAHINCNWKTGMDAFCEGYHVPTIHAGSLPGLTNMWSDNLLIFGDHRSLSAFSSEANPPTPVGNAANDIFSASIVAKAQDRFALPPGINPTRSNHFGFEETIVFPNLLIQCGGGLWFTHQFWPTSQNSCLWEGKYYLQAPASNSEFWAQRYAVTLQRNAWYEDTATMEDTQRALSSGVLKEMHFMDEEILLRHAYRVIDDRVNSN
ncbi:MAG TPA: aromatic ring-hydroxylating dioxygenase subunit alpha [Rhizomicrobium sp.]|nr:aromatic ring-hydroxylating dioxygenase subunit alpha [Rhizomicrobium sp.]